jgi:protein AroM
MSITVGAITIGQSPRPDVVPEMRALLGREVRVVERGALDRLTPDEIAALARKGAGPVLVTRLRDGAEVRIREDVLVPRVAACVRELEDEVELILLLCTGSFPPLPSRRPILSPEPVLYNVVRSLGARHVGVLTPAAEQLAFQRERWQRIAERVTVGVASPYGPPGAVCAAAEQLARTDADVVVMDCIGYTGAMKALVRERVRRPVVLARSALARVAAELMG